MVVYLFVGKEGTKIRILSNFFPTTVAFSEMHLYNARCFRPNQNDVDNTGLGEEIPPNENFDLRRSLFMLYVSLGSITSQRISTA